MILQQQRQNLHFRCAAAAFFLGGYIGGAGRDLVLGRVVAGRVGLRLRRGKVVPVDEAEDQEAHHPARNYALHVLHPELVLELAGRLLELAGAVLQGIRLLVQLVELLVALQHLLHVVAHDADDLVDLGLLLGHPFLGHDLLHLGGAGERFTVRAERPAVGSNPWLRFSFLDVGHFLVCVCVDGASAKNLKQNHAKFPGLYGGIENQIMTYAF